MLCHVTYFCPHFQFCVLRCLCSTTYFWFPGLSLCHMLSSTVCPPVSALSGHVWSSSVRCCTSCRPSSLRTSLWTVRWWASEMGVSLPDFQGREADLGGPTSPSTRYQAFIGSVSWRCPDPVSPNADSLWNGSSLPIPESLCLKLKETSLNSPDCGAVSYSFLLFSQMKTRWKYPCTSWTCLWSTAHPLTPQNGLASGSHLLCSSTWG